MKKLEVLKDDSDEIESRYAPQILEDDDNVKDFIEYWFDEHDLEDHDGYQKNVSVEEESNGVYSAYCSMSRMWTGTKRFKLIENLPPDDPDLAAFEPQKIESDTLSMKGLQSAIACAFDQNGWEVDEDFNQNDKRRMEMRTEMRRRKVVLEAYEMDGGFLILEKKSLDTNQ